MGIDDDDDERAQRAAAYEADRGKAKMAKGPPGVAPKISVRTVSTPKAERPAPRPTVLLVVARTPGACGKCRHANQGTSDFAEGRAHCARDLQPKTLDQKCDVTVKAPRTIPAGPESGWHRYYYFEQYDGKNGTHGLVADFRVLASDADSKLQEFQRAHLKS